MDDASTGQFQRQNRVTQDGSGREKAVDFHIGRAIVEDTFVTGRIVRLWKDPRNSFCRVELIRRTWICWKGERIDQQGSMTNAAEVSRRGEIGAARVDSIGQGVEVDVMGPSIAVCGRDRAGAANKDRALILRVVIADR